jgi:hypothetical protein
MADQYVIAGFIDKTGKILANTGQFSVVHVAAGVYTVIFQYEFLAVPVVVTSQVFPNQMYSNGGDTRDNALVIGVDQKAVRLHTGDRNGASVDREFTFIAWGFGPGAKVELSESEAAKIVELTAAEHVSAASAE